VERVNGKEDSLYGSDDFESDREPILETMRSKNHDNLFLKVLKEVNVKKIMEQCKLPKVKNRK